MFYIFLSYNRINYLDNNFCFVKIRFNSGVIQKYAGPFFQGSLSRLPGSSKRSSVARLAFSQRAAFASQRVLNYTRLSGEQIIGFYLNKYPLFFGLWLFVFSFIYQAAVPQWNKVYLPDKIINHQLKTNAYLDDKPVMLSGHSPYCCSHRVSIFKRPAWWQAFFIAPAAPSRCRSCATA